MKSRAATGSSSISFVVNVRPNAVLEINHGPPVNTVSMDAGSALSFHGTELYFSSNHPGGFGSYRSTRSKLRGTE